MKEKNTWLHPKRFRNALIVGVIFTLIGTLLPYSYLRFFDNRKYIDVIEPVTFDRKVYSAGETQIAKLILKIDIDSETKLHSRLMMVLMDNQYRPVNSTSSAGFVIAKETPQTFVIPASIPCDLEEGNYFYRAELHYKIKGIDKFTGFESELFTINNTRASDSAQIAKNCKR